MAKYIFEGNCTLLVAKQFSTEVDFLLKAEVQMKVLADLIKFTEPNDQHDQSSVAVQQLKSVMLYLAKAKLTYQKSKTIFCEKSMLTEGNIIVDHKYDIFSFVPLLLLFASLCPIILANKVKKLSSYMRIMKKVIKKIFALILIYGNIITLFKNLLVYFLYPRNKAFQKNDGYISTYSKIISMMVGELNYEDTFTIDKFSEQVIFIGFVFIITIMLNNLLIGMTTSNVQKLMEEANRETTLFMLREIIDFYGIQKIKTSNNKKLLRNCCSIFKNVYENDKV